MTTLEELVAASKEEDRLANAEYYQRNKEALKVKNKLYWDENKEAMHSKQRKYYQENKERLKAAAKTRYNRTKELATEIKAAQGCLRCGEKNPVVLEFHHRNPAEKEVEISNLGQAAVEKVIEEIAKCDVLCANCHRIVEWEQREAAKEGPSDDIESE